MSHMPVSRRSFISMTGVMAAGAVLGLVGCSNSKPASSGSSSTASPSSSSSTSAGASSGSSAKGKSLIVLWSWSGNTLKMAERLSTLSGAEIYRIQAADPYPEDYNACLDRAKQEQNDGVYPEIANPVQNWDEYDTIFVGYPIWWYKLPMITQGFVNDHDWTGKTVIPFNSHEGSGDSGTYDDLGKMTGAKVLKGIAIRGSEVSSSLDKIDAWYAALGL